jgi:hypothetical protein
MSGKQTHNLKFYMWDKFIYGCSIWFNATFSTISVIAVSFIGVENYQSVQNDYIIRVVTSFERVVE